MADETDNGKDFSSARLDKGGATDVPSAGIGPPGPADPVEQRQEQGPATAADIEGLSAHYGAGEPEPGAPAAAPTSSARYPASSAATGATRPGDKVTGVEDGPARDLDE